MADGLPWIEPLEGRLLLAVDVWTGNGWPEGKGNLWSVADNWSNGVPQVGDTVKFSATPYSINGSIDDIPFTGSMEVDSSWGGGIFVGTGNLSVPMTLTSLTFDEREFDIYSPLSPLSVNYLNLSGGTINNFTATSMTLNGRLSDGASGQWSGGTINLNGSLINKGTFTLSGSGTLPLNVNANLSGSLINQGTIIQDGTSNLVLNAFTELDNQGNYTFLKRREHYKWHRTCRGRRQLGHDHQGRWRHQQPRIGSSAPPSATAGRSM